jgi:hypothetical protein
MTTASPSPSHAANGLKGGQVTAQRYGREHYREIGRKAAARRAELIAKGREAEATSEKE